MFLLFTGQSSARVIREARVTRLKENAELAFYAAEAGFNRARARFIKQGSDAEMLVLNGRSDTLTYVDGSGATREAGTYTLEVVSITAGTEYQVTSVGTYGPPGPFQAKRVVRGTIVRTGNKAGGDRRTQTTYSP